MVLHRMSNCMCLRFLLGRETCIQIAGESALQQRFDDQLRVVLQGAALVMPLDKRQLAFRRLTEVRLLVVLEGDTSNQQKTLQLGAERTEAANYSKAAWDLMELQDRHPHFPPALSCKRCRRGRRCRHPSRILLCGCHGNTQMSDQANAATLESEGDSR